MATDDPKRLKDDANDIDIAISHITPTTEATREAVFRLSTEAKKLRDEAEEAEAAQKKQEEQAQTTE